MIVTYAERRPIKRFFVGDIVTTDFDSKAAKVQHTVIDRHKSQCQSGYMVTIKDINGRVLCLDADWCTIAIPLVKPEPSLDLTSLME